MKILRIDKMRLFRSSTYPFTCYFKGFDTVKAVRSLFGENTDEVLRNLKVEFTWIAGYMWISSEGHLMISSRYLNNGSRVDIYLDVIHELVHVKQFMEGKELFDGRYRYVERPTEIEAYRHAVEEAKRIGMTEKEICEYLKTEWMSDDDLKRLAKTLNVNCSKKELHRSGDR